MKNTNFYPTIWQTIPYTFEMADHWNTNKNSTTDLVLKNIQAKKEKVSEMNLNVNSLSIIDSAGNEHIVQVFLKEVLVNIKGMHSGFYIKTKNAVALPEGNYTAIRFNLSSNDNSLNYTNRSTQAISGIDSIDFEIVNGLQIDNEVDKKQLVLQFDLESYSLTSFFKPLLNLF